MSNKNNQEQRRNPSILTRFLWWCAGIDQDVMKNCPHEWAKYASMGGTVLFTGMFAAIAGGYALYTVFRDGSLTTIDISALLPAIGFGIFWGAVIFNLDRYIITTFKKSDGDNGFVCFCKDLLHALPRILLAIIIAITISKPIELKLFERRLAQEIIEIEQRTQTKNAETYYEIYNIEGQKTDIQQSDSMLNVYEEERQKDPISVATLKTEKEQLKKEYTTITNERNNALAERKKVWNNDNNFVIRYDTAGIPLPKEYADLKPAPKAEWKKWNFEYTKKKNELEKISKKIEQKEKDIKTEKKKHQEYYTSLINQTEETKKEQKERLQASEKTKTAEIVRADSIAKIAYTNNFVTQLEALSSLKRVDTDDLNPADVNYVEKIKEREKEAHSFAMISLAITLLFLCIELAPILTKLISTRGTYDELIEAEEYHQKSLCHLQIDKQKQDYESEIQTYNEEKRIHYQVTVESNQKLMEQIASVQAELLETAIEEWRKEELAKIKANPSQYIQSNTKKS